MKQMDFGENLDMNSRTCQNETGTHEHIRGQTVLEYFITAFFFLKHC